MTQRTEIIKFLLENPNSTSREVQDNFLFPPPSIRRVLSNLRKEQINIKANKQHINRIFESAKDLVKALIEPKEKEEEPEEAFLKIIKSKHYCSGVEKWYFALTYEDNKIDRGLDLIRLIDDQLLDTCSESRAKKGYADNKIIKDPPFLYPEFEYGLDEKIRN